MGQSHPLATFIPIINDSPWTTRRCQTHRPSPGASHLTSTQQEAREPQGALEGEASRRPSPSGDVVTIVTARTGQRVLKTSKQDTVASTVADASSQPDAPGARLRSGLGQPRPRCPSPVHGPARCRQEERRTDSDWKTSAGGRRCRSSSVKSMQGAKRLKSHENKHSQESWAGRALTPGDGGGASTAPAPRLADAGTSAAPWPGRTPHANSPGSRRPQPRGQLAALSLWPPSVPCV